MVDPADIAAVAVAVLTEPGHLSAVHRLSGPHALTPPEQVQLLGEALGRKLTFEEQPDAEAGAAGVDIFRRHPELQAEVQDTPSRDCSAAPQDRCRTGWPVTEPPSPEVTGSADLVAEQDVVRAVPAADVE